ncbi:MAG: YIP1 family protein [Terracidiphilus sp.]|jgi:cbb3-type cytochrome oxidase subunit 3
MNNLEYPSAAEPAPEAAGLSQWQRVTNTFTAPSKTFEDIQRGNKSWWLPFLIMVLIGYVFFAAVTFKVGWAQVAENAIHLNPKSEEKLNQAPPAQRETAMKITQYSMEGGFAASPILVLIFAVVIAVVLWGTINFVFGGKAKFGSVFAVWMFAALPGIIKSLLGSVVLFAGAAPESFNLNNFAPTSVGAFLNPLETNAALYKLASSLDITTIWYLFLMGMGLAIVAGVKRTSGYIAVFGWWALIVLITVGWTAAFS